MLLFSINRIRGYENPSLDIIVIELYSIGGCPLEEAHEHCFQIQSAISVVILISFQCYCGECFGYIVVILPLLAFYFCSAYILYLVYYKILKMDLQEGMSNNKAPLFNGRGYSLWKIRMKNFMLDLGFDIWQSVVDGYTAPTSPPKDATGKKICNDNSRAWNSSRVD
jgi:hypothetical protein